MDVTINLQGRFEGRAIRVLTGWCLESAYFAANLA